MWSQIRDKLRINWQFIYKNEKLKRLTIAISSHKYVVPVLRKSDRLHNNHAIITVITIPFVQMTERDERRNWRHIKILFYAIKTISCQIETVGLQTFYGYNLTLSFFLTWGISYIPLLIVLMKSRSSTTLKSTVSRGLARERTSLGFPHFALHKLI